MPSSSTFSTSRLGTPWTLPPGMRATRATRALARLYEARPDAALSEAEVETALATAGAAVNKVTVYRLLDRFAAAGLLHKQVDAARVTRYVLAPQGGDGAAPRTVAQSDSHGSLGVVLADDVLVQLFHDLARC